MNLNYDKIRRRVEEGGNHWTSYSDLFLVLTVVFLLLYVIANLRAGTLTLMQQAQLQQAQQQAEALQKQIHTYDVLKEDYLANGASPDEVKMYRDLMDKMDLLAGDARKERDDFAKKAQAADEKQRNLNYYQQMVKNIISANLVASGRVKKRDQVISAQDKDIDNLNTLVEDRESQIAHNNQTIDQIKTNLEKQIQETRFAYRSKQNSKVKMEKEISALQVKSRQEIYSLEQKNTQFMSELEQTQAKLEQRNREAEKLMQTLTSKEAKYKTSLADLERQHQDQMRQERELFEANLNTLKLGAEEKLAQQRAYAASVEKKNQAYQDQVTLLNRDLQATRGSIDDLKGRYQASIKSLEQTNQTLAQDLTASQNKLNEQRTLAEQIRKNFGKAGIDASVDGKTGDVTINFQNEYFDTGSSNLKNGMKNILEKTIPVYAKSLMENPKISKKIGSVEIVGFASPTYQGRSVDPESLSPQDRTAVNYNMDLSYQRAKAIFEHIFDTSKMQFEYQKKILPMIKVSGRSYLATDKLPNRDPASLDPNASGSDYCSRFDCKKSQKVIIRFNLKEE